MNDQLVTLTQRWVFPLSPVLLTRTGPLYRCHIFHFEDLKTVFAFQKQLHSKIYQGGAVAQHNFITIQETHSYF